MYAVKWPVYVGRRDAKHSWRSYEESTFISCAIKVITLQKYRKSMQCSDPFLTNNCANTIEMEINSMQLTCSVSISQDPKNIVWTTVVAMTEKI